jgi:hypothetical protein
MQATLTIPSQQFGHGSQTVNIFFVKKQNANGVSFRLRNISGLTSASCTPLSLDRMKILPGWILMGKYSETGGAQYLEKKHKTRAMDMINLQMSDDRMVSCQLCVVKEKQKKFPAHLEGDGCTRQECTFLSYFTIPISPQECVLCHNFILV